MKTTHFLALFLLVALVAPCTGLTVSAVNLKWIEQNVKTTTTHEIFITENPTSAAVVFYGDKIVELCSANPQTLIGNGSIVLTCNPPADSAIGYARVSEITDGGTGIATGIRLPIELSATNDPATPEPPQESNPATEPEPAPAAIVPDNTVAETTHDPITPAPIQTPAQPQITITTPINEPVTGAPLQTVAVWGLMVCLFLISVGLVLYFHERRNDDD